MAFIQLDFFSDVLGMCMQANVIIPQETRGQIGMDGVAFATYPTLYLLHGMSDDHTIWMRRTSIERYVSERGMAVVMPSTHLGWYTDTQYGMKYFTYLTEELPVIMQSFFNGMSADRKDNYIAGLSMGGYGALKAALSRPDIFCAAASLSGAIDAEARSKRDNPTRGKDYWQGIFGNPDKVAGGVNDLFALAEKCKQRADKGEVNLPELFMWCGTEDFLFEENRSMKKHLEALNYSLKYSESAGCHRWDYWDEQIQNVLLWIDELRKNGRKK